MYIKPADTNLHSPMPNLILPLVIFIVLLMLILHCPLLRVKVNTYSVLGERLVIVYRLVVHSAPSDGGSQLTEVGMLLGSLTWSTCAVSVCMYVCMQRYQPSCIERETHAFSDYLTLTRLQLQISRIY